MSGPEWVRAEASVPIMLVEQAGAGTEVDSGQELLVDQHGRRPVILHLQGPIRGGDRELPIGFDGALRVEEIATVIVGLTEVARQLGYGPALTAQLDQQAPEFRRTFGEGFA